MTNGIQIYTHLREENKDGHVDAVATSKVKI